MRERERDMLLFAFHQKKKNHPKYIRINYGRSYNNRANYRGRKHKHLALGIRTRPFHPKRCIIIVIVSLLGKHEHQPGASAWSAGQGGNAAAATKRRAGAALLQNDISLA